MSDDCPPEGGACKGQPTDWWFPLYQQLAGSSGTVREQRQNMEMAKEICRSCSVRTQCLEYSLHHEPLGVWGGLDERERHAMRRRLNIAVSRGGVPRNVVL